ncbi:unnamed protein product, partial [Pylaiella littoralis]
MGEDGSRASWADRGVTEGCARAEVKGAPSLAAAVDAAENAYTLGAEGGGAEEEGLGGRGGKVQDGRVMPTVVAEIGRSDPRRVEARPPGKKIISPSKVSKAECSAVITLIAGTAWSVSRSMAIRIVRQSPVSVTPMVADLSLTPQCGGGLRAFPILVMAASLLTSFMVSLEHSKPKRKLRPEHFEKRLQYEVLRVSRYFLFSSKVSRCVRFS